MARKLALVAYSRLEATLNGYKVGKAPVDWRGIWEGVGSPGSSLLVMVVLLILAGVVLASPK